MIKIKRYISFTLNMLQMIDNWEVIKNEIETVVGHFPDFNHALELYSFTIAL